MKKNKYINLIAAALIAVAPAVGTITSNSVVSAATKKPKTAKKNTKKSKKTTKKTTKKNKKSPISKIIASYDPKDTRAAKLYRKAYKNRYKKGKKWYVDLRANKSNIPTYDDDHIATKETLKNKAGDVYTIPLEDLDLSSEKLDNGSYKAFLYTSNLGDDGSAMYDPNDFTFISKYNGKKVNLMDVTFND